MSAHHIDSWTEARINPATTADKQPWVRIIDMNTGESVLIEDRDAIRNLRAACDAALGEGEGK
jgi:hypothetical protein